MDAQVTGRSRPDYDALVVGGGPAGLSAALYLGRSRRRTLLVDAGEPRNAAAPAAHGVFTRDGTPPHRLLLQARRQLAPYATVEFRRTKAVSAARTDDGFSVRLGTGSVVTARRLLLACGVVDELPPIDGLAQNWGTGVLHCAYCHGYEVADEPLAVYARGKDALAAVAGVLNLSRDVVLCSDGPSELPDSDGERLRAQGIPIVETRILRVDGSAPDLRLRFVDDSTISRSAIFLTPQLRIASGLPAQLGCEFETPSRLVVSPTWETTVPGVYAAGDLAMARKQVAIAAASGAEAAMSLNGNLGQEDLGGEWSALCANAAPRPRAEAAAMASKP
jgi:thioredoxin reductase